jgi:flagellar protein FlaI
MTLIAESQPERSLEDLREMESVKINIDPAEEQLVPRPDPGDDLRAEAAEILENAEPLYERYRTMETPDIVSALTATGAAEDIAADAGDADADADDDDDEEIDFGQFVPKAGTEAEES